MSSFLYLLRNSPYVWNISFQHIHTKAYAAVIHTKSLEQDSQQSLSVNIAHQAFGRTEDCYGIPKRTIALNLQGHRTNSIIPP